MPSLQRMVAPTALVEASTLASRVSVQSSCFMGLFFPRGIYLPDDAFDQFGALGHFHHAVDDELHADTEDQKAHDLGHGVQTVDSQYPYQAGRQPQGDVDHRSGEEYADDDGNKVQPAPGQRGKTNGHGNSPRAGQAGHGQRREGYITLAPGLLSLRRRLAGVVPGVEHAHADPGHQDAAGYAQAGQRQAEELHDEAPADQESHQNADHVDYRL